MSMLSAFAVATGCYYHPLHVFVDTKPSHALAPSVGVLTWLATLHKYTTCITCPCSLCHPTPPIFKVLALKGGAAKSSSSTSFISSSSDSLSYACEDAAVEEGQGVPNPPLRT